MNTFKKIDLIGTLILALMGIGVWQYWQVVCGSYKCTLYQMEVLQVLLWGSTLWAILFGTLLVFPSAMFQRWFYFVASWGVPLTFYIAFAIDPRSGGVLAVSRGQAAWFVGILMAGVTVLFICGWYARSYYRALPPPAPYSRLLSLIITSVVLYILSVM